MLIIKYYGAIGLKKISTEPQEHDYKEEKRPFLKAILASGS